MQLKFIKPYKKRNLPNTRALFASTGVKSSELVADYYIQELMYPNTINTAPISSINEFIKNSFEYKNIPNDDEIDEFFKELENLGIDMKKLSFELLNDGLKAFCIAFDEILQNLE